MRRQDELAAGAVVLPVSRSPPGPSGHQRMRSGAQRCPKRCFRTRPWVPSSGWLEGVPPPASGPQNWSVKSSCGLLGRCRGRLPHPDERGLRRRSGLGHGRKEPRGAAQALGVGRPIGRVSGRVRTTQHGRWHVPAGNAHARAQFARKPEPGDVTGLAMHCGRTALGCAARAAPRENPDAIQGPVRDGDG
jgi:hypothetical protein